LPTWSDRNATVSLAVCQTGRITANHVQNGEASVGKKKRGKKEEEKETKGCSS